MAAKIAIAAGKRDSPGLRRDSEHPHSAAAMVWCCGSPFQRSLSSTGPVELPQLLILPAQMQCRLNEPSPAQNAQQYQGCCPRKPTTKNEIDDQETSC